MNGRCRLVDAIPGAWDRVVEAAVSRKVDFVVVSGDIFDSVRASYRDYLRFFDGLNRLDAEGIPSYLCTGNHDPLSLWQQDFFALPPSATMLAADRPDFALYERDGRPLAVIGGRGYPNKVWSPNEDIAEGITRAARHSGLGPRCRRGCLLRWACAHRAYARSREGSHRPRGRCCVLDSTTGRSATFTSGGSTTSVCRALPFPAAFKGAMCVKRARAVSTSSRWRLTRRRR